MKRREPGSCYAMYDRYWTEQKGNSYRYKRLLSLFCMSQDRHKALAQRLPDGKQALQQNFLVLVRITDNNEQNVSK
jgi:hypothetical protein